MTVGTLVLWFSWIWSPARGLKHWICRKRFFLVFSQIKWLKLHIYTSPLLLCFYFLNTLTSCPKASTFLLANNLHLCLSVCAKMLHFQCISPASVIRINFNVNSNHSVVLCCVMSFQYKFTVHVPRNPINEVYSEWFLWQNEWMDFYAQSMIWRCYLLTLKVLELSRKQRIKYLSLDVCLVNLCQLNNATNCHRKSYWRIYRAAEWMTFTRTNKTTRTRKYVSNTCSTIRLLEIRLILRCDAKT